MKTNDVISRVEHMLLGLLPRPPHPKCQCKILCVKRSTNNFLNQVISTLHAKQLWDIHLHASLNYSPCAHPKPCWPTHTCWHTYIMRASSHATLVCAHTNMVRMAVHLTYMCIHALEFMWGFWGWIHNSYKLLNDVYMKFNGCLGRVTLVC